MSFIYCDEDKIYNYYDYTYKTYRINYNYNDYVKPIEIKQICSKYHRTCILTHDNRIFIFSLVTDDLVSILQQNEKVKCLSMGMSEILTLYNSGKIDMIIWNLYKKEYNNINIDTDNTIISIDSGYDFHMIHKKNGIWKFNNINHKPKSVKNVNVYLSYNDGSRNVACYYDLYHDDTEHDIDFMSCGHLSTTIKLNNNNIIKYNFENKQHEYCIIKPEFKNNIKKISNGFEFDIFLTYSGQIWCIENNYKIKLLIDGGIYDCWNFFGRYMCLNDNNEVHMYDFDTNEFSGPTKIPFKIENLILLVDKHPNLYWKPNHHHNFSDKFHSNVILILLFIKLMYKKYNLKIPKYVSYIVINFLI